MLGGLKADEALGGKDGRGATGGGVGGVGGGVYLGVSLDPGAKECTGEEVEEFHKVCFSPSKIDMRRDLKKHTHLTLALNPNPNWRQSR